MAGPFVVVGGDAAGLSAASKCRREDPDREVIVLERGEWVSYAHCGTPYYVAGVVGDPTDLLTLHPEDVAGRGIDLRRNHEVVGIDVGERSVTIEGPDGTTQQAYGDLLVGTGARAVERPFTEGLALTGAFTLHHMDAAAALRAFLADPDELDPETVDGPYVDRALVRRYAAMEPPTAAAIVGGGYVGVEMAEALSAHDLPVHLFQRSPTLLSPFGEAVGEAVETHLREQGVTVHTDARVSTIAGKEGGQVADDGQIDGDEHGQNDGDEHGQVSGRVAAVSHDGGRLPVDLVVVGVGVRPNTDFLPDAIDLGPSGAVATDEYGRTAVEDVYAAGDCAESRHAVTGEPAWVPLGLTANRAGRAVGQTVAGEPTPMGAVAGTAVLKAFDLGAGRTGILDAVKLRAAGFDPVSVTIDAPSRSTYYPGSETTTVTLVADRGSGRVVGGATVGRDRAAKRIDPVAMAIQDGLTVADLERRDLGYAPPFSPVWDPVLVAAKVLNGELD